MTYLSLQMQETLRQIKHYSHNFKLVSDLIPVLVTDKFEEVMLKQMTSRAWQVWAPKSIVRRIYVGYH